jgi:trehalose-6-phosphate synthase
VDESDLRIGVLSRRAPIRQNVGLGATLEHVGGLTRVIPALAEFAEIAWTTLTTQSQVGMPLKYSFEDFSGRNFPHGINIFLAEVDHQRMQQSDWFCTHYIWPLLHDLPITDFAVDDLDGYFESIKSICQLLATKCIEVNHVGYLVNDFQLSQVPALLKELEPEKPITFFLHTPWPKLVPNHNIAIKILNFLATGMLDADVIEFQTQKDLQAFEDFVLANLPIQTITQKLKVNPVSVNVQELKQQSQVNASPINVNDKVISYVHIARSDPIKNTLETIRAFTTLVQELKELNTRRILDLYVVPSRQQWPDYQALLSDISNCVVACNALISQPNYVPIRLHIGNDYLGAIHALTHYDYLIACSVADGLNLVVKEGAILNTRNGVIISTPNLGAMAELGEHCVVAKDPSESSIVAALLTAANLDARARSAMAAGLKNQVTDFDANHWAKSVVANFKVLETV